MFVKYDCGCIGIPFRSDYPEISGAFRKENQAIIIKVCDIETYGNEYSFFIRDMTGKTYECVTEFEQKIIIGKINSLITRGYALTEIRHLLKEH